MLNCDNNQDLLEVLKFALAYGRLDALNGFKPCSLKSLAPRLPCAKLRNGHQPVILAAYKAGYWNGEEDKRRSQDSNNDKSI